MVKVTVGDQDSIQTTEAEPGAKDLALRPLAAIDQEARVAVRHDMRR
jgi:hypothetical protein